ncbi:MAG: flagellar basal body P-ring formation protein FlgA [Rhodobacteraceae bacterium]|nr:flagellar basal body P-ring formation protein FlgA [Paracoccaceae bacterium]
MWVRGIIAFVAGLFLALPAMAESLVATRLIRATDVIGPLDVTRSDAVVPGAASHADQVIGLEARVAIYPGRPVRLAELAPAAVIERNDLVQLVYRRGGLTILAEGRALSRGAIGALVNVMNTASRQSVQGRIVHAGLVAVAPQEATP